jgi:hypothetical protein
MIKKEQQIFGRRTYSTVKPFGFPYCRLQQQKENDKIFSKIEPCPTG